MEVYGFGTGHRIKIQPNGWEEPGDIEVVEIDGEKFLPFTTCKMTLKPSGAGMLNTCSECGAGTYETDPAFCPSCGAAVV